MNAVGVYIGKLRDGQGITQLALAEHLGVSDRIVRDWERGRHEPKIGVMIALLEYLRGAWDDVELLMRNDASEELAHQLARQRLTMPLLTHEEQQYFAALSDKQKELVTALIEETKRQMMKG